MQDKFEKFMHDENIKKFTVMLTVETGDDRREMLTRLLAEETVRLLPSGWSGNQDFRLGRYWQPMGSVFAALPSTNARVSPVFQGRNCTLAANTGETRSAMKVFDVELIRQKGRSRLSDTYFCIWP